MAKRAWAFVLSETPIGSTFFDMFENVNSHLFETVKRELRELKECARTDSMGLDKIFYFPGHQFPKTFNE